MAFFWSLSNGTSSVLPPLPALGASWAFTPLVSDAESRVRWALSRTYPVSGRHGQILEQAGSWTCSSGAWESGAGSRGPSLSSVPEFWPSVFQYKALGLKSQL